MFDQFSSSYFLAMIFVVIKTTTDIQPSPPRIIPLYNVLFSFDHAYISIESGEAILKKTDENLVERKKISYVS